MNSRKRIDKLAVAGLFSIVASTTSQLHAEDTLYVWAGDVAHKAPDFFAVVDFDKGSPTYGKVVNIAPLPKNLVTAFPLSSGAVGNEPHHVGISADKKVLAGGGLLSILRVQNQNFFWDITTPRAPKWWKANTLPVTASIADEFVSKQAGGFFVTFMGGAGGLAPGRVVEYDNNYNEVGQWPAVPPLDGFNPHGIAIDEAHNLLLTSDFVCPLHTLNVVPGAISGGITPRGKVRVWDLSQRKITKSITVGDPNNPPGTINTELIPGDPQLRAYVTGVFDGKLYLVDPGAGTAQPVLDLNVYAEPGAAEPWPHLFKINAAGTRLALTLNYKGLHGKVLWINIEDRTHPVVKSVVNLGPNSGPHYINWSPTQDRLIVADYFLVQDLFPSGVVKVDGDHKIHAIDIVDDALVRDPSFNLDFNRDIATGPARPHGVISVSK
jgi:selenium-binding protein 1